MAETTIQDKLTEYLEDAHAMESSVLRMLDSMIATTQDPAIRAALEHHQEETQEQANRLRERLDALSGGQSRSKDAMTQVGAMMKGMADLARSDKPMKNARDGYMVEHMEIAAYELLRRVAELAGDPETVAVCDHNLREEREMASTIASNWDRFVDLTLAEEKVSV